MSNQDVTDGVMDGLKKLLGANLRALRTQAGLTQDALGKRTGLGRAYIHRVENAATNLTLESMTAISVALDCSVPTMLSPMTGGADKPKPDASIPQVGSVLPPAPGTMAIELPSGRAFDAARILSRQFESVIALIDPTNRTVISIVRT